MGSGHARLSFWHFLAGRQFEVERRRGDFARYIDVAGRLDQVGLFDGAGADTNHSFARGIDAKQLRAAIGAEMLGHVVTAVGGMLVGLGFAADGHVS